MSNEHPITVDYLLRDLARGYAAMTADKVREDEAQAWVEALISDAAA